MRATRVRFLLDDDLSITVDGGAFVCDHPHVAPVEAVLASA
jgi:hypothetical protein